jgi:hypothetical protein
MASSNHKHGPSWSEISTRVEPVITADSGISVAIGSAPVHMVRGGTKNVNKPLMFLTLQDALATVGWSLDWGRFDLCELIYSAFQRYRFSPIILINVFDPMRGAINMGTAVLAVTHKQVVFPFDDVIFDSVVVEIDDDGTKVSKSETKAPKLNKPISTGRYYVLDRDYSLEYNNAGKLVITILPGGSIPQDTDGLLIGYSRIGSTPITADDVIGGVDQNGRKTGIELIEEIHPRFNIVAGYLMSPAFSSNVPVLTALASKAGLFDDSFRCMVVGDVDLSIVKKYQDAEAWKTTNGLTSHRQILCYLRLGMGDKRFRFSVDYALRSARLDAANGGVPYESASNKKLEADAMYDGDGNPIFLSRKEANYLNSLGIVTGRSTRRGLVIWGSNTAAFPGTSDVKDRFIPNRRQMDFIGNTVVTTFDEKVDKPGNRREIDAIVNDINLWLADQQNSGYLLEHYVRFDHEENPDSEILNGHYKVRIGEGSPTPIESLEFVLEFTTGGFASLAD